MHGWWAAGLAVGAAMLAAVGTVLRQRATASGAGVDVGWVLGGVLALAGFGLQAAALALGSVLLVQPLIVLSVLFELPVQSVFSRAWASAREWGYGGLVAVGVAGFVFFAHPVPARHGRQVWVLDVVLAGLLLAVAVMVVWAYRSRGHRAGLLFGTAAGSLFGLVAVQVKAVTDDLDHPIRMLHNPTFYLFAVTVAAAIFCQQKSFTVGAVQASYPAMVVAEPVVAMAVSLAILGEKLTARSVPTVISTVGLAVMIFSVLRLARLSAAAE